MRLLSNDLHLARFAGEVDDADEPLRRGVRRRQDQRDLVLTRPRRRRRLARRERRLAGAGVGQIDPVDEVALEQC